MRFDVLTLFPEMFSNYLGESLFHQSIVNGLVSVGLHSMRDWTYDRHRTVDDRPFGGGPGMVLKVEPVVDCVEAVQHGNFGENSLEFSCKTENFDPESIPFEDSIHSQPGHLVMLTPAGRVFRQTVAEELVQHPRLVFLCGRYEGFDDRVRQILCPDEISIGDYVLNGGEVASMVMMEAIIRLIPGVLGDEMSSVTDSFSSGNRFLESAQFTRPRVFRGLEVPEILFSGHHANIEEWHREENLKLTKNRRPDLIPPGFEEEEAAKKKKKRRTRKVKSEETDIENQNI